MRSVRDVLAMNALMRNIRCTNCCALSSVEARMRILRAAESAILSVRVNREICPTYFWVFETVTTDEKVELEPVMVGKKQVEVRCVLFWCLNAFGSGHRFSHDIMMHVVQMFNCLSKYHNYVALHCHNLVMNILAGYCTSTTKAQLNWREVRHIYTTQLAVV